MNSIQKKIAIVLVLVVVLLLIYSAIPAVIASNPSTMKEGNYYHLFGHIVDIFSSSNESVFVLNDSGQIIVVSYNGPVPSVGSNVLVSGKFDGKIIPGIGNTYLFHASSVVQWYVFFP